MPAMSRFRVDFRRRALQHSPFATQALPRFAHLPFLPIPLPASGWPLASPIPSPCPSILWLPAAGLRLRRLPCSPLVVYHSSLPGIDYYNVLLVGNSSNRLSGYCWIRHCLLYPGEVLWYSRGFGPVGCLMRLSPVLVAAFLEMAFSIKVVFVAVPLTGLVVVSTVIFPSLVITGGVIPVVTLVPSIVISVPIISLVPVIVFR